VQGSGTPQESTKGRLRVLIAGGGTGGHVIPALAIARELRDAHGAEVRFVGTTRGLETRLVPGAGFRLELVRSGQLKNVSLVTRFKTALDVPRGVMGCVRLIREFRPNVVLGVGGYASGPGMIAAILLRVPTVAFEPNAVPGLANRVVGRLVSAAAVNFNATRGYFHNAHVTGIPVRKEFFTIPAMAPQQDMGVSAESSPLLLVFGGSLGARIFNTVMPTIASGLLQRIPGLRIVHQCGAGNGQSTSDAYVGSGAEAGRWDVLEFLNDMPGYFAKADLIVCRSGASTVAELAAAGRPAVLVPFPGAADNHQLQNARVLVEAGAARLIEQSSGNFEEALADGIKALLLDPAARAQAGRMAKMLARPNALAEIAALVARVGGRSELA
jgi:UDP-N-acetylglucosamine--N-acetylmuramyl-(pentapeptide) pyrophosphoryl-undecaprenol N-acetylglucosamine transferase